MIWFVMLGGALGAGGRYALGRVLSVGDWPAAIFVANVLGSFLIGALAVAPFVREGDPRIAAFLVTGALGGFTTFSTFSFDVVTLAGEGRIGAASIYAGGSLLLCIAGCWLGMLMMRGMSG